MENLEQVGTETEGLQTQEATASIPEAGEQPQGGQAAAPAAGNWNPNEWTLNFKGQKITPKDKQHLINLAQQGYSYSQSMEQLKREREEFDQSRGKYKPYEDMDKMFQTDPNYKAAIMDAVQRYQEKLRNGGMNEEQVQRQALPPEILNQIEDLKQFKSTMLQREADNALKQEKDELKRQYPNVNFEFDQGEGSLMKRILKHAMDNGIQSLKTAYRDFMYDNDTAQARAEALKKADAEKAERLRQGKIAGSGGSKPAPAGTDGFSPKDDWNALEAKALKRLG